MHTAAHLTAVAVAAVVAALATACGERAPEGALLLTASRLYVAPDDPPIDDAAVLIVDGRIAAVGPVKEIPARGAKRLPACDGGTVSGPGATYCVQASPSQYRRPPEPSSYHPAGALLGSLILRW